MAKSVKIGKPSEEQLQAAKWAGAWKPTDDLGIALKTLAAGGEPFSVDLDDGVTATWCRARANVCNKRLGSNIIVLPSADGTSVIFENQPKDK